MRTLLPALVALLLMAAPAAAVTPPPGPSFSPEQIEEMKAQLLPQTLELAGALELNRRCPTLELLHTLALEVKLVDSVHKLAWAELEPKALLADVHERAALIPCAQAHASAVHAQQAATLALFEWSLVAQPWARLSPDRLALTPAESLALDQLMENAKLQLAGIPGFEVDHVAGQARALAEQLHDLRAGASARQMGTSPPYPIAISLWLTQLEEVIARLVDGLRSQSDMDPKLAVRPSLDTGWVAYAHRSTGRAAWRVSQDIGCAGGLPYTGMRNCPARLVITPQGELLYIASAPAKGAALTVSGVVLRFPSAATDLGPPTLWRSPDDDAWHDQLAAMESPKPVDRVEATATTLPALPAALTVGATSAWIFPEGTAERLIALPPGSVFGLTATLSGEQRVPTRSMAGSVRGLADALAWGDAFALAITQ